MQNKPEDEVSLLVGGRHHSNWQAYRIDSDLLTPADAWQLTLAKPDGVLPPGAIAGAPVQLQIGGETVLSGRIDDVNHDVSKQSNSLEITGRDGAAVLVDCSAPIFVAKQVTLKEVVANVVKPLGITRVRMEARKVPSYDKVNVEPGETAWDTLVRAAESAGLWPWFEPDGTLVIGGPDYNQPVVDDLVMRFNGVGNNAMGLNYSDSIAERFSHVTVLGQAHGTSVEDGRNALKSTVRDTGIDAYRPLIVVDHDADNKAATLARANKLISDSILRGRTLVARVLGHRTSGGVLWRPGQRVRVLSEPHGIDRVFFLMGRTFTRSRQDGPITTLSLKEDRVWVLDAHPHTRRRKRGKNLKTGEIIEIPA